MTDEEKKFLLSITKVSDNIDIEVNRDNIEELRAVVQMAIDDPGIKDSLKGMFYNIVGIENLSSAESSRYSNDNGSVILEINGIHDNAADIYSTGFELLTAALAELASKAIASGQSEMFVMEHLINLFATTLSNAIPSVEVRTMGNMPLAGKQKNNSGNRNLLS